MRDDEIVYWYEKEDGKWVFCYYIICKDVEKDGEEDDDEAIC